MNTVPHNSPSVPLGMVDRILAPTRMSDPTFPTLTHNSDRFRAFRGRVSSSPFRVVGRSHKVTRPLGREGESKRDFQITGCHRTGLSRGYALTLMRKFGYSIS